MQGRAADRDTAHLHRFEQRERCQGAGSTDGDGDILDDRNFLSRGKLVGDGPTGTTRLAAELILPITPVQFDHDAVDLKRQLVPHRVGALMKGQHLVDGPATLSMFRDGQAPGREGVQFVPMGRRSLTRERHDVVAGQRQRAGGSDPAVQLTQGTGCGVARIGEGLLPPLGHPAIERLKLIQAHVHFTTHDQVGGHGRARSELEGQGANRPKIDGDIFTDCAVSARCAAHKSSLIVDQFDRQPVELRLGGVDDLFGFQLAFHAGVERTHILLIGHGVETQHRLLVRDLCEFRQRRCPDPLGGGVAGDQVRMGGFQIDQFAKESVVFRVGNLRPILRVIEMVVASDFSTEGCDAFFDGTWGHGLVTHG